MLLSVLALIPIIWLIIALTWLKMPGHWACVSALVIGAVLALIFWRMPGVDCFTSALEGFASALWPIIIVIIAAIFTYNLCVKTGAMDIIKQSLTSVSADKRIIILIIAWCFGGFMEGMAGFGTAIAIPAAMMAGMGWDPIVACVTCMISNAFPTAFGSIGIPTVTLQTVTGLQPLPLAFTTVFEMTPFMILVPFLMIMAGAGGPKALKGVVGITLIAGVSFVVPELIISYYLGPSLPVIVGCIVSLVCTMLAAKARKNKPIPAEYDMSEGVAALRSNPSGGENGPKMSPVTAWLPFILIFVLLLLTSNLVPPINHALSIFTTKAKISTAANAVKASFSWINTPAVWIFIAAIIGGIAQKASGKTVGKALGGTFKQMYKTIITIMAVLALAKIMTYSGMIADMAHLFVVLTGRFYPFVAPIIAAIGAFVTGSGTNTQVLLGTLQTAAAKQIGVSEYWLAAANQVGAGIGKIMSPQCVATGVAALGIAGQDSKVMRAIAKWCVLLLVIGCLLVGFGVPLSPA